MDLAVVCITSATLNVPDWLIDWLIWPHLASGCCWCMQERSSSGFCWRWSSLMLPSCSVVDRDRRSSKLVDQTGHSATSTPATCDWVLRASAVKPTTTSSQKHSQYSTCLSAVLLTRTWPSRPRPWPPRPRYGSTAVAVLLQNNQSNRPIAPK